MKQALAALAVAVTTAIGVWTYHHPPLQLPPPHLTNTGLLAPPPPPPTRQLTKIISASACTLANGYTWNGPGVSATYGAVLPTPGDYLINPNAPPSGNTNYDAPPDTVLLFCDARLPAEAAAFDYAELEYFAADEVGNSAPTLTAFLDTRAPSINGFAYDQTIPLASCTGPLTPLYSGINPVSLCDTDGGTSLYPDAGLPLVWPGAGWTLFSLHFLVSIPPSPDPTLPNLVYRVLVYYEAP
jgi:hypothetical protein